MLDWSDNDPPLYLRKHCQIGCCGILEWHTSEWYLYTSNIVDHVHNWIQIVWGWGGDGWGEHTYNTLRLAVSSGVKPSYFLDLISINETFIEGCHGLPTTSRDRVLGNMYHPIPGFDFTQWCSRQITVQYYRYFKSRPSCDHCKFVWCFGMVLLPSVDLLFFPSCYSYSLSCT